MKQIIPFKKDIIFKTNLNDITTISLEHDLALKERDLISGSFSLSGKYKMSESSPLEEDFSYDLPFDIALDSRFDTSSLKLDIDDFNYEIVNNEILRVSIDVSLDNLISKEDEEVNIFDVREESLDEIQVDNTYEKMENDEVATSDTINQIDTIMDSIQTNESYTTYHICIVREDDTIEKIMEKYKVSKDELKKYNPSLDIQIGDKLIIPSNE